jgi:hypothetical protein
MVIPQQLLLYPVKRKASLHLLDRSESHIWPGSLRSSGRMRRPRPYNIQSTERAFAVKEPTSNSLRPPSKTQPTRKRLPNRQAYGSSERTQVGARDDYKRTRELDSKGQKMLESFFVIDKELNQSRSSIFCSMC